MKLIFSEQAWDDYLHWQKIDKKLLERINVLIKDISRSPFEGIGNCWWWAILDLVRLPS